MKQRLLLGIFITIFVAIMFVGNCSDPLESLGPEIRIDTIKIVDTLGYSDTLFIIDTFMIIDTLDYTDTLFVVDTIMIIDTLDYMDTVYVVDTVNNIDTVFIYITDTTQSQTICSRISSCRKKIVWMLRNQEGKYKLEFTASQDGKCPVQTLYLYIDGHEYRWKPVEDPELIKELYLEENSTIRIKTYKPPAFGHTIYICLTISKI